MSWNLNDFITPELLVTFSGAVAVVAILTQFTKRFLPKVDPKWIALVLATLASTVKRLATGDLSAIGWVLAAFNAIALASAAVGAFEGCKGLGGFFTGRGEQDNGSDDI